MNLLEIITSSCYFDTVIAVIVLYSLHFIHCLSSVVKPTSISQLEASAQTTCVQLGLHNHYTCIPVTLKFILIFMIFTSQNHACDMQLVLMMKVDII